MLESRLLFFWKKNSTYRLSQCVNNINNKVYIGSGDPLYTRLSDYYRPWYLIYRSNLHIVRAFNKYTMGNFSLYILKYINSDNII